MSELSPLSGVKWKSDLGAVRSAFDTQPGHRRPAGPARCCLLPTGELGVLKARVY